MNNIAGIPYVAVEFDKDGKILNKEQATVPANATDVMIISHGWNNTREQAEQLYADLFTNFAAVASDAVQKKKLAILGVIWPSKKFTDVVEAAVAEQGGGGGAGFGPNSKAAEETIALKLHLIAKMFGWENKQEIKAAKEEIPRLEADPTARDRFVEELRRLLNTSAAHEDDNSKLFFELKGSVLLEKLKMPTPLVATNGGKGGGGAAEMKGKKANPIQGGAAGLGDIFSGIKAGAIRFLNYLTYYEMKQRAGTVGKTGVAPLIDLIAAKVERVHLVGHSFGGRVVTAAAAASATDKLQTMSLLQTAFSHNGFSKVMNGFFRSVVDQKRVKGPILVTYTPNDRAVGIAYPTASRLSGTVASAYGDKNDKYGGLGRNGAQKMEPSEVVSNVGELLAVGGGYAWQAGRFHNLESSKYIVDPKGGDAHGFVTGKEVAWAISRAIA